VDARRRRLIEARNAAREGRRFHAFYRGYRDRRQGRSGNPYQPGSQEAACWESGWKHAEGER
jgi:hypothetical protein